MNTVSIMSVIGSAVPANLRDLGLLACWYVVKDGEPLSGPLLSRVQAQALFLSFKDQANAPLKH
ncbi:hypothetical protein PMM47T1_27789 [Pseudomonas sp. M47T1]|uniref:hypothetical protein n=1 Tax=Pseudomonas sp. M47T1 TaxID=1179778 RepID=UPI000260869A|nr:hypothetical protein [Pseudomonas sp. M47T1]EIK93305.1 hypothetical protein PMM47T1_27789 [Pseudomonas sp. M47T1]